MALSRVALLNPRRRGPAGVWRERRERQVKAVGGHCVYLLAIWPGGFLASCSRSRSCWAGLLHTASCGKLNEGSMLERVCPEDQSEQVPAPAGPRDGPEPHALRWPVRALSSDPWQQLVGGGAAGQAGRLLPNPPRPWVTTFFASLHFLEQLARDVAATGAHAGSAGCFAAACKPFKDNVASPV